MCFDLLNFSVQIKSDARVPWGGGGSNFGQTSQDIALNNSNDTTTNTKLDGFHLVNLTDAMVNMTSFNIFMKSHVIDSRRCAGNETSFTYKGTHFYLFCWFYSKYFINIKLLTSVLRLMLDCCKINGICWVSKFKMDKVSISILMYSHKHCLSVLLIQQKTYSTDTSMWIEKKKLSLHHLDLNVWRWRV